MQKDHRESPGPGHLTEGYALTYLSSHVLGLKFEQTSSGRGWSAALIESEVHVAYPRRVYNQTTTLEVNYTPN